MSGTSMAAPAVTGTVALLFSAAGRRLPIEETRRLLLTSCDPPPEGAVGMGSGYLNPARALAGLSPDPPPDTTREPAMTTPDTLFPDTLTAEADAGLWVAGAERLAHPKSGGLPYVETAPWRFVLHTIEGQPSAAAFRALAARHGSPPHLWAMPSADLLLQVIPLDRGAFALAHPPGTVHTNRLRAVQVECWGFARDMGGVPTAMLDWLAERVLRPVAALVPIDLSEVRPTAGERCYGAGSTCRMSDAEWLAFDGVCGHQHVPHNAHWDPGLLDLAYLAARAAGARGPLPRRPAAEAEALDAAEDEPADDTRIHGESEDWAEGSTRSDSARLEWVKLTETPGGKSPVRLLYLLTGPAGGGPSRFCLRVTNTNDVYNLKRTSVRVRLRAKTGPDQTKVVPLRGGKEDWVWVRHEGRELADEESETVELYLDPATRRAAYDSDEPLHWLDVEYHWYEGPGRGRSAYYATRSLPFNLVAPTELLLKEKRFLGHHHLDAHRGLWKFLYSNPDPWPVTYKLTMETSVSNTTTGEVSATVATTVTRGKEATQQRTEQQELSLGIGIENMFSLGQKLASSVTSGVTWSQSVSQTFTDVASLTKAFTKGHTTRLEVESKIPAAPAGRRLSIYGYPVVALYEVPVVLFGGANELGQASRRSTGKVPVVWLSGYATTRPILS
jgi:hypothetical protein